MTVEPFRGAGYAEPCRRCIEKQAEIHRLREVIRETQVSRWDRESVIAAIQAFRSLRGYQPVSDDCGTHGLPSYRMVVKHCGSWNAAVEAAGFRPYPARSSAQAKAMAHRDRAW
jgi:hypothetical protein